MFNPGISPLLISSYVVANATTPEQVNKGIIIIIIIMMMMMMMMMKKKNFTGRCQDWFIV